MVLTNNTIVMYGGQGIDSIGQFGYLSDLWILDPIYVDTTIIVTQGVLTSVIVLLFVMVLLAIAILLSSYKYLCKTRKIQL